MVYWISDSLAVSTSPRLLDQASEYPKSADASNCWSPDGKQILAGDSNRLVVQLSALFFPTLIVNCDGALEADVAGFEWILCM
jgi:hypothetical protein